ncbi:MAG: GNAT family N-acetyltransferase [Thermoplasmata archaeon]|nr:GNAT family N-acetyltransferase [Thermoplasmata archaeon]
MMRITIRRLTSEDYDEILSVWEKSGLPIRRNGRDSRGQIAAQLNSGNVIILGEEADGRLVGIIMITHDARKGWLNRLAVLPEHQKEGVATKLIEKAEEILKEKGFEVFCVLIEDEKLESKRLFEKLGYNDEQEIRYYTKRLRKEA